MAVIGIVIGIIILILGLFFISMGISIRYSIFNYMLAPYLFRAGILFLIIDALYVFIFLIWVKTESENYESNRNGIIRYTSLHSSYKWFVFN